MVMFISLIVTDAVSGSVPTSLHKVSHLSLSAEANTNVGMSKEGDIVLKGTDTGKLYMYKYDGKRYLQKWEKVIPAEAGSSCYKAVNRDGDFFLQNDTDKDTICYSSGLHKQYFANHKGELIDTIGGELFYLEKFKNFMKTKRRIKVYNNNHGAASTSHTGTAQEGKPLTLLPPWRESAGYPSVCHIQQNYVVVERWNKALDVFDPQGMFLLPLINCGGEGLKGELISHLMK